MREIQRKCQEKEQAQALNQPKPVKALWKSQKYDNVESKVKARLQVSNLVPHCAYLHVGTHANSHQERCHIGTWCCL